MFDRATITLGIGPHFQFLLFDCLINVHRELATVVYVLSLQERDVSLHMLRCLCEATMHRYTYSQLHDSTALLSSTLCWWLSSLSSCRMSHDTSEEFVDLYSDSVTLVISNRCSIICETFNSKMFALLYYFFDLLLVSNNILSCCLF